MILVSGQADPDPGTRVLMKHSYTRFHLLDLDLVRLNFLASFSVPGSLWLVASSSAGRFLSALDALSAAFAPSLMSCSVNLSLTSLLSLFWLVSMIPIR